MALCLLVRLVGFRILSIERCRNVTLKVICFIRKRLGTLFCIVNCRRVFFFSSRRRHTRYIGDWSSDACSSDLLALDETFSEAVERYRYIQECAVLARGLNQATALEAALKMTETSYLVAKPYSGADFLHGPIAMVSEGFPCFLFAPDGRTYPSMVELALKLRERAAEMIVIAHSPEILDLAVRPLRLPVAIHEMLSPLLAILPGQLWAYHLARARGKDPDKPRGLSKV